MRGLPAATLLLSLLRVSLCIQVIVPEQERRTFLFASVLLRCDYTTSANPRMFWSPGAYQSALQLGQDPANDCPDRQRRIRTVIQKRGLNQPTLGPEYRGRRITIQDNADLLITEVMWDDNGVYFCSVDAAGDTSGDSDKEIKLIVFHWLTVLLIIIGAILLIILLGVCCCQCCPQRCCCYVRCPCCPQQCCCPEKAVMQHRMMKEAQRAMAPWLGGQPVYGPMSNASSQMNPLLYSGSVSGKSIPLKPMPLPPPQSSAYSMPAPSMHGNHTPATNRMLDYMESQVRGMDMASPLLQNGDVSEGRSDPAPLCFPNHLHPSTCSRCPPCAAHAYQCPILPGPPSMISALDDGPAERRLITLPPIREQNMGRMPPPAPKTRPPSSSESSRSGFGRRDDRRRNPSPTRSRGMHRSYSQDSLDARSHNGARGGMDRPRSRSRDDLFDSRSRANYSPPAPHRQRRGSWGSVDNDASSRRGGGGGGGRGWGDKPPSYTEYEPGQKRYTDKSSRSGNSIVI
ncbi:hypothetical protein INR49_004168 [Caranx melampygus]|nr:hypothetical protein INR49_004168 [Caranx melampygus]